MIDALFNGTNYQATKKLLDVAAMRHQALASNLANVETPGFKRVDLPKDFQSQLRSCIENGDHRKLQSLTPTITQDLNAMSTRADGNTVQLDRELLEMSGNTANFDALTQFASSSLKRLKMAITGRDSF